MFFLNLIMFMIIFIIVSFAVTIWCRIKEAFAPLVTMGLLIMWGMILASLNILKLGIGITYIGVYLVGIFFCIKRKQQFVEFILELPICALIGSILVTAIVFYIKPPFFMSWDEYSHWGPFLFNIKETNALHVFSDSYFIHQSYPQGMTILYYIYSYLKPDYSEIDVCLIYSIFLHTCVCVVIPNVSVKENKILNSVIFLLMPVFLYLLPYTDYAAPYTSVYLDIIAGAFMGSIVVFTIEHQNEMKKNTIAICEAILLFGLLQIKDISIAFYFICLATLGIVMLIDSYYEKQTYSLLVGKFLMFGVMIPLSGKIIWKILLNNTGKTLDQFDEVSITNLLSVIQAYLKGENAYIGEILEAYWYGINNVSVSWHHTAILVVAFLYFIVSIWCSYYYDKLFKTKTILINSILFIVYFICYLTVLVVIYLCGMSIHEALCNASMDRYVGCFFVGWGIFIFALIIKLLYKANYNVMLGFLITIVSFIYITFPLNNIYYFMYSKEDTGRDWCEEKCEIIQNYIDKDAIIWVQYGTDDGNHRQHIFAYLLMPCVVEKRLPVVTTEYSYSEMLNMASDYNIEYIVVVDNKENFRNKYKENLFISHDAGDDRCMIIKLNEDEILQQIY